ncbi:MAG: polysaccharide deacetylase family protein [Clostridia bacterium]|nr:polysaccharide deacetylase family protein [Clostridia bacterium]
MEYRFLRFPEGKTKAVTFSYDDACQSDLRFAELLDGYGMKGTFNVNSLCVLDEKLDGKLHLDDLNSLISRGHEIALHGHSHKATAAISPTEAVRETLECRLLLEGALGRIIRGMAYPDSGIRSEHNGNTYATVKGILESVGVVYSRTLGEDNDTFALPADFHAWMPTIHHDNPLAYEYVDKFISMDVDSRYKSGRWPRLFYVWGHTFEFDRNNNWDHAEELCRRLSGKEDVWYATNIEIYDYIKAYNSLVISADSTLIYNPTLYEIWFNIGGRTYSVASGKTFKLD